LLPGALAAQILDKGNFMAGASIGFSSANSNTESTTPSGTVTTDNSALQFSITPRIGYFLLDGIVIGISMDYTLNQTSRPVTPGDPNSRIETETDSDLLFGPYSRLYFLANEDKALFGEVSFGFGSSSDKTNIGTTQSTSTNVFAASIGPGFTIFSRDAIGIEALVKYNFSRSSFDIESQGVAQQTTTWTHQVDLSIGLQFYFSRLAPAGNTTPDRTRPNNPTFY
jgi:hypothetical protein